MLDGGNSILCSGDCWIKATQSSTAWMSCYTINLHQWPLTLHYVQLITGLSSSSPQEGSHTGDLHGLMELSCLVLDWWGEKIIIGSASFHCCSSDHKCREMWNGKICAHNISSGKCMDFQVCIPLDIDSKALCNWGLFFFKAALINILYLQWIKGHHEMWKGKVSLSWNYHPSSLSRREYFLHFSAHCSVYRLFQQTAAGFSEKVLINPLYATC